MTIYGNIGYTLGATTVGGKMSLCVLSFSLSGFVGFRRPHLSDWLGCGASRSHLMRL